MVEVYATAYDLVLIIQFEALLEIDYIRRFEKEKTLLGGALYSHSASHYVLLDNTYLGDVESVKQRLLDCGAKLIEPDIVDNMQSANRETARCLGRGCTAFLAFSSHNPLDKTTERPYYKKLTIQL